MPATEKPNVIWIFGDQHPWHALSCNGNMDVKTPNIDALAAVGVNFINAVAGYPLCCPFRGSLLTGKYPHREGAVLGHQYQMDPAERTVAHAFNDAGYVTAYFGKWHVDGFQEERGNVTKHVVPPHRRGGFKHWIGYENNNRQWDTWVHGGEGEGAFQYKLPGYETDCLAGLLIEHLEKHAVASAPPLFAVLSVQPPHNPYFAPESFMERHFDLDAFQPNPLHFRENVPSIKGFTDVVSRDLAGAYAMIENLDWNVGRILDALDATGLAEKTTIVFFSDHGDMHGSHGHQRKTSPYNESVRIPFIIGNAAKAIHHARDQGKTAGTHHFCTSTAMVNHVDIGPTTLGLCGIAVPPSMEGTDYSNHVRGDGKRLGEPDSSYLQSIIPTGHHDCVDKPWRGILTVDGWKYACFEGMEWLLFNLNDDPFELQNLAHYHKFFEKKLELNDKLGRWIETLGDAFDLPNLREREKMRKSTSR